MRRRVEIVDVGQASSYYDKVPIKNLLLAVPHMTDSTWQHVLRKWVDGARAMGDTAAVQRLQSELSGAGLASASAYVAAL